MHWEFFSKHRVESSNLTLKVLLSDWKVESLFGMTFLLQQTVRKTGEVMYMF